MERQAEELFAEIAAMGEGSMLEGVLHGVENGWFTQRIAEAAFDEQRRTEAGELIQVGVNAFEEGPGLGPETLQIAMATERAQIEAVERVRAERDAGAAADALRALTAAAAAPDADLIEPLITCARAHCTGGRGHRDPARRLRHVARDPRLLKRFRNGSLLRHIARTD